MNLLINIPNRVPDNNDGNTTNSASWMSIIDINNVATTYVNTYLLLTLSETRLAQSGNVSSRIIPTLPVKWVMSISIKQIAEMIDTKANAFTPSYFFIESPIVFYHLLRKKRIIYVINIIEEGKIMNKRFFNVLFCFILAFTVSCSSISESKPSGIKEDISFERIPLNEIFLKMINRYYVLIFSSSCLACQNTIEVLNYKKNEADFDLFLLDYQEVRKETNKSNIGVMNYQDISYESVPLLFVIENKIIINEIYGFENIREMINTMNDLSFCLW